MAFLVPGEELVQGGAELGLLRVLGGFGEYLRQYRDTSSNYSDPEITGILDLGVAVFANHI